MLVDVSDEKRSEQEVLLDAAGFQGFEKALPLFCKVGEGQFFNLGNGEAFSVFFIDLGVGVDGLFC